MYATQYIHYIYSVMFPEGKNINQPSQIKAIELLNIQYDHMVYTLEYKNISYIIRRYNTIVLTFSPVFEEYDKNCGQSELANLVRKELTLQKLKLLD